MSWSCDDLKSVLADGQISFSEEKKRFRNLEVLTGKLADETMLFFIHGKHSRFAKSLHCFQMIGMTVCDNSQIDLILGDVQSSKILTHIFKEMFMAGIYDYSEFAINKVGVAVILCIDPPYKGMETIKYLHEVNLLSVLLEGTLQNPFPSEFNTQIELRFKNLAERFESIPVR